jgi:hypothetical protein
MVIPLQKPRKFPFGDSPFPNRVCAHSGINIYIDDMIPLTVDIPGTDNLAICAAAGLLAIQAKSKHINEPSPREEMEAKK